MSLLLSDAKSPAGYWARVWTWVGLPQTAYIAGAIGLPSGAVVAAVRATLWWTLVVEGVVITFVPPAAFAKALRRAGRVPAVAGITPAPAREPSGGGGRTLPEDERAQRVPNATDFDWPDVVLRGRTSETKGPGSRVSGIGLILAGPFLLLLGAVSLLGGLLRIPLIWGAIATAVAFGAGVVAGPAAGGIAAASIGASAGLLAGIQHRRSR